MMHAVQETRPTTRPKRTDPADRVWSSPRPQAELVEPPPFEIEVVEHHETNIVEPTYESSAKPLVYGLLTYMGVLLVLLGVAYSLSLIWT